MRTGLDLVDQLSTLDLGSAVPVDTDVEELLAKALVGLGRPAEAIAPLARALEKLVRAGQISPSTAYLYATNAGNLRVQLADVPDEDSPIMR